MESKIQPSGGGGWCLFSLKPRFDLTNKCYWVDFSAISGRCSFDSTPLQALHCTQQRCIQLLQWRWFDGEQCDRHTMKWWSHTLRGTHKSETVVNKIWRCLGKYLPAWVCRSQFSVCPHSWSTKWFRLADEPPKCLLIRQHRTPSTFRSGRWKTSANSSKQICSSLELC